MNSISHLPLWRCGVAAFLAITSIAPAGDWPTHMANNQRTGITVEQLPDASLTQKWTFTSPVPPQTAWFRQMRYDGSNAANGEKSQRAYDSAFNICVAGSDLFYASSSEYAVVCIDVTNGTEKWRFITEGPVRIAPSYSNGKLYFGSDDGRAYCVNATNGTEVWRYSPTNSTDAIIVHNLDFVSLTPCRTGVLVQNGKAYAGFGMLPWESAYLVALNADTGAETYKKTFNATSKAAMTTGNADFSTTDNSLTFEGSLLALADNTRLFVPQGRMSPISFDMATGNAQGRLAGAGGSWTLITPDNGRVVVGPSYGNQYDSRRVRLHEDDATTRTIVASYERANALLVSGAQSYVIIEGKVQAKNRSTAATVWTKDGERPNTMITGGTTLYVGSRNKVLCLDTATGSLLKSLPATGDVFTLALANGRLFASTTRGVIHCYAQ